MLDTAQGISAGGRARRRWLGGPWQSPDSLKRRGRETISLFGSQSTTLALPLTAVLLVGVLGLSVAWLWVLHSPVRELRRLPEPAPASASPLGAEAGAGRAGGAP